MPPTDSGRSSVRGADPVLQDSGFDVSPFLDALESHPAGNTEILATVGSIDGVWLNALRDLASSSPDRQSQGRDAARASWRKAQESGEVWVAPRIGLAVEQIRQAHRAAGEDRFVGDLHDALALVHWVALVEDPFCVVAILVSLEDDASGDAVLLALASLGDFTEEVVDRAWDEFEKRERACACRLLSRTHGAWGASRLAESLDAMDIEIRVAAARALASRGEPNALGELVRCFEQAVINEDRVSDAEVDALEDAIVAIAGVSEEQGRRVSATLSEWLVASEESVRIGFAQILARLESASSPNWVSSVLNDPSPAVREVAASALSRVGSKQAVGVREQVLGDEAEGVRMAGAVSLGQARDREALDWLERLVSDPSEGVRTAALRSLAIRLARDRYLIDGERGFSWVDEGLRLGGLSAIAAVELLPHLAGSRARSLVEKLLASPAPDLVCAVLTSLGRESDPSLVATVRKALDHPDASVRIEAAQALVDVGEAGALPAILARVERERDPQTRSALLGVVRRHNT